ncbi:MAG: hypothetical protein ABSA93_22555 [Streptosporangiaceae bacterium]|jgi:hypothetical protein
MTDPPRYPGPGSPDSLASTGRDGGQPAGRARWKTVAILVAVVALLAVMIILHVTGVVGSGTNG